VLAGWRLDRPGRSLPHLVTLIVNLHTRGVGFRPLVDGVIHTTTASGEMDAQAPRVQIAKVMHQDKRVSIADICQTLRISHANFSQYLAL
jgi:DNA invertase Pin-like site-specific DNA recombinase